MTKKFLTLVLAAMLISLSACDIPENLPAMGSEAESSLSESSSSESSSSEIIPEEPEEPEPVIEPSINILSDSVERGSYYIISAENIDLSGFSFEDPFGYSRRFFEKEGIWYCLVPVDSSTEAGTYPFSFTCGDFTYETTLTVEEREFKTQYLVVEQSTLEATLEDERVRNTFAELFEHYRWHFSDTPLWNGEFVKPLGDAWYRETTSFGTFRTFSSGRTEWHNATDMAAAGGTPVYATNNGIILFSGYLGLTGNTIIIDHGCGIMSWHYHLSTLDVSEGNHVEKNDFIGRVGTTGLSTGNHLHFGISVGGVFTDPMQMLGTEPNLDFEKVKTE